MSDSQFPKFLMTQEGQAKFVSMQEAGRMLSSLWSRTEVGNLALEADFSVRKLTPAEQARITSISDECDADK